MYFDAHSDIWNDVTRRRMAGERQVFRDHHLRRLRQGGCEGGVLAIWVEREYQGRDWERTCQIMQCVSQEAAESRDFRIVSNTREMRQAAAEGLFYALPGAEGLAAIGDEISGIDEYYEFGVRLVMLTWNEVNALAAGAASGETTGLTEAGRRAVQRIWDLGMVLDVSHLNEAGFWDIIRMAGGPVVASHSNCRALCDVPRNLTDDQLRAIRDTGGVVGVNAYRGFVSPDRQRQTVEQLALHVLHMAEVMGVDHVGCGFDFCEMLPGGSTADNPRGLEDCSHVPDFFRCLETLGFSREEREKIARGNFLRVLEQVLG